MVFGDPDEERKVDSPEQAEEKVEKELEEMDWEKFQDNYSEVLGRAESLDLSEDALQVIGGVIKQLELYGIPIENRVKILTNTLDTVKVQKDGFGSEY